MVIRRDKYLNKLISKKHNHLIKVITGLRRCGKSYLLFQLFHKHLTESGVPENHIIEIAFDSFEYKKYRNPEILYPYLMERMNEPGMYYFLLDEIQFLDDFESVLNSLARKENADVYVTGSNAKLLSRDIITEFRGRGDEVRMYPLSFSEYMSVYPGSPAEGWRDYVLYGGLPLIFSFPTAEEKGEFLKSILEETYLADIIGRNRFKNKAELEEILNILSSAIGSLTNPHKLSDSFRSIKGKTINQTTIKRYLDAFSDSFLLESALRYDIKGKKYIDTPSKYYFSDLGLRNARLNFRQVEESHAMENILYNELRYRGFNVDVGVVVVNSTDADGKNYRKQLEIDFVCNKGSQRYYIQSALSLSDVEKRDQEERSLKMTQDGFKKIIVTKDAVAPLYNENGILEIGLLDFLLHPESMEI